MLYDQHWKWRVRVRHVPRSGPVVENCALKSMDKALGVFGVGRHQKSQVFARCWREMLQQSKGKLNLIWLSQVKQSIEQQIGLQFQIFYVPIMYLAWWSKIAKTFSTEVETHPETLLSWQAKWKAGCWISLNYLNEHVYSNPSIR